MLDEPSLFTVTDLKQFAYCPRVVFYEQCLPHVRPRTYKMDAGRQAHDDEQKRAARRTFTQYDLPDGKRYFDVRLHDTDLMLTGLLDEVIETPDQQRIPVDYKLAKQVSKNHRLQLAAYALLLEASDHLPVPYGFIYLIPLRKMRKIQLTDALKAEVISLVKTMDTMLWGERMPAPTPVSQRCVSCEFRRFCNDV